MTDYADVTAVKTILEIPDSGADTRLAALNSAASRWLEQQMRRTFGTANPAASMTLAGSDSSRLLLPKPLKSVQAVWRGNRLAGPNGNPSFATDLSGWALDATSGLTVAWERDTATQSNDTGSLVATVTGSIGSGDDSRFASTTALTAVAGQVWALQADLLASGAEVIPLLALIWEDSNHDTLSIASEPSSTAAPTDWTRRTLIATAPANAAYVRAALIAQATQAAATGQVWFDTLSASDCIAPNRYQLAAINRQGEAWMLELTDGSVWNYAFGYGGVGVWDNDGLSGSSATEPDVLGPGGAWTGLVPGPLTVVGDWADADAATVPALVQEAATVLVAGWYRRDRAAGGDVSGPHGLTFTPGDPTKDARVQAALQVYAPATELIL